MSGFWYTAAIATTLSAVLSLAGGLKTASSTSSVLAPAGSASSVSSGASYPPVLATKTWPVIASDDLVTLAPQNYRQALAIADQAVEAYQAARQASEAGEAEQSLIFTRLERTLWQDSLKVLARIPADAAIYQQATEKQTLYKQLMATADGKIAQADSSFLADVVSAAGVSPDLVHISLCQIERPTIGGTPQSTVANSGPLGKDGSLDFERCRHHRGDQLMASPASLIKLPIAISLMHKVATEDIDLEQEIFIDPGNFTENAAGALLSTGESYPLREVMGRMIKESNNIATNQLIDYLGRDYIAKALRDMGYTQTLVNHKLVGDRILPDDPGTLSNESTTNELTAMMAEVYRFAGPGDEELLNALISQRDRELGYAALQDMGSDIHWIGEKTGQNNQMLGSTLAVKVDEERYALTVAINNGGDPYILQSIIRGIVSHLVEKGALLPASSTQSGSDNTTT